MELVTAAWQRRRATRPRVWAADRTTGGAVAQPELFTGRLQLCGLRAHGVLEARRVAGVMALGHFLGELRFDLLRFTAVGFLAAILLPPNLGIFTQSLELVH
jgi:hypothetical protein